MSDQTLLSDYNAENTYSKRQLIENIPKLEYKYPDKRILIFAGEVKWLVKINYGNSERVQLLIILLKKEKAKPL